MTFVLGIDFGLAVVATLLLLVKRPTGRGDPFLIAVAAVTGVICGGAALLENGFALPSTVTVFVGGAGFMVLPALVVLYVRAETGRLHPVDGLWLAPAALHEVWGLSLWHRYGGLGLQAGFISVPEPDALPNALPVLIGIVAPIVALWTLRDHRSGLRDYWTDTERFDLNWAAYLLIGTLAGSAAGVLLLVIFEAEPRTALVLIMAILGAQLTTFCVFAPTQVAIPLERAERPAAGEALELIELTKIKEALFESERFWTEGYSLATAAEDLGGVDPKRISASLAAAGTGFYDFVNGLRIERACALLADPDRADQPILALAFEAGFQSKATFNRVFKTRIGQTPSAYRRAKLP